MPATHDSLSIETDKQERLQHSASCHGGSFKAPGNVGGGIPPKA